MRRPRLRGALCTACAVVLITSCGHEVAGARPGPSASEILCAYPGTVPPSPAPGPSCPKIPDTLAPMPAPTPTPTVTMTPYQDAERYWSNPTCSPAREPRGVTRHGTALGCYQEGEWHWMAGTSDGDPCVDEGEWSVKGGVIATVCRDGTWHQERLENPTPTPTVSWSYPGPGKIPYPSGMLPSTGTR